MLKLDLRLVVNVLSRMAHAALVVITEGSVVAIVLLIRHILLHVLPTLHGESIVGGTAEREEIVPTLEV